MKIKCVGRQEFAIGGWTDPQRSRVGLGALLVGYYEGDRFRYAGKVGTGYTREVLLDLRRRFDEMGRAANPFDEGEPPAGEGVHWVEPELVAEIAFAEWTQNGLLRQPRYEGLRPDKSAQRLPPRAAESAAAVRRRSSDPPGRRPPCRWRNTTAKRDFTKTREPVRRQGEEAQAADLRRAGAPRLDPPLRLPPRGRRRAQELVGPQGPVARPVGEAAGRPGRGPPDRLRDLRGHDPPGPVRRRDGRHLGPRHL